MSDVVSVPIKEVNKIPWEPNYDNDCRAYKNDEWLVVTVPYFSDDKYLTFHLYKINDYDRFMDYMYSSDRGILPVELAEYDDNIIHINNGRHNAWYRVVKYSDNDLVNDRIIETVYNDFKSVLETDLAEMLLYLC